MSSVPPPTTATALSFRDVRVRRGNRDVLHVPSLAVTEGETLAVLGPNGSGKSTLLLAAALLIPGRTGAIRVFEERGVPGRKGVALRRRMATVFQDPALLDMPARRNIETALRLRGVPRRERRARAEQWLNRLGVAHLADAMPHTLSSGEAQRVSLARAFAVQPRLLFLDEPLSSLDLETRSELIGDLRALLRDQAVTAILVTHDHSEVQLLADRALVLLDGEPAQVDTVEALFARPSSPEVAAFLGYALLETRDLRAARPPLAGDGARAAIRPSAVRLAPAGSAGSIEATVLSVQGAQGLGRLLLKVGRARFFAELPADEIRREQIRPSVTVVVCIDPAGVITWDR